MKTYFVVQAFVVGRKGALIADMPREARDEAQAIRLAERLASNRAGVIAFSRTGDPTTGDYDDAVVLARHGRVPAELVDAAAA